MVTDEYEKALLGAILAGYRDLPPIARQVSEPDFYRPEHGAIWDALLKVHASGEVPNPLTALDAMGAAAHRLPGGATYLYDLAAADSLLPVQAPFYAEKVRQASVKRQVGGLGTKLRQLEADDDVEPEDMLALVRRWFDGLDQGGRQTTVSSADAVEQVFAVLEHGEPSAIPSPWPSLNELINGWYPGQLVVIAALTGVGKSIMLENVATDAARSGRRVLFCSLEMSAKEITQRTMAHTAQVPLTKIRKGMWDQTDPDYQRMVTASSVVIGTQIQYADDSRQTVADVRARAWELKQAAARDGEELGMIVVDYLQLLTARDHKLPRHQQVGEMCRGLKALARELQVPVVTAAQMSRASVARSNPQPILADLRESGDIEHTADVVMFLHEEMVEEGGRMIATGDVDVIVAKQRAGSKGVRTLEKHGHFSKFAERRH